MVDNYNYLPMDLASPSEARPNAFSLVDPQNDFERARQISFIIVSLESVLLLQTLYIKKSDFKHFDILPITS